MSTSTNATRYFSKLYYHCANINDKTNIPQQYKIHLCNVFVVNFVIFIVTCYRCFTYRNLSKNKVCYSKRNN